MRTFHCPHAVSDCSTCESSGVAREIRRLRAIEEAAHAYRSARRLLTKGYSSRETCEGLLNVLLRVIDDEVKP